MFCTRRTFIEFYIKKILGKKGADYGDSYYDDDDDAYGGPQVVPVPVPMPIPRPPGPRITGPGMPAGKNNAPNEIDRIPCGRWRCCTGRVVNIIRIPRNYA